METYEDILTIMQDKYRELSGFGADAASDIGIRLRVLAAVVLEGLGRIEELRGQVFPQSSTGQYLEYHAQTRGITRKAALPALGALRFYRETPAQADIPIAKGILCATRPAGEQELLIPARAVDPGFQGNVAPGAVCLMVTPAPGISGVENPLPFSGGVDAESDDDLRQRLLRSFSSISNGTNCAFYYDIAMEREGVASANVLPRRRGRGTVDVVVTCHDSMAEPGIVAGLAEELGGRKEINVDVAVQAARRDSTPVDALIAIGEGCDLSHVGAPLLLARLTAALLEVEGVENCRILSPAADLFPGDDHVIRPGEIAVTRMEVG